MTRSLPTATVNLMSTTRPLARSVRTKGRRATSHGGAVPLDGRARRSHQSRDAIVNALFELVGEGHLDPTAQQVAARADVGLRSVFRHFSDMESLYSTLDARLLANLTPLLEDDPPDGTAAERAEAMVDHRVAVFERILPYKRASNLKRWRSPYLTAQHRRLVTELRTRLVLWLPELRSAPPETIDAIEQATSFEAWDRLRIEQRLGKPRARAAMVRATTALVATLGTRA